jgi:hypothetical protein
VRSISLPAPEYSRFSAGDLAFAGRAWRMKADQEYLSAGVFAELTAGLLDDGIALETIDTFSTIVSDEVTHAALCDRLARELGNGNGRSKNPSLRTRLAGHGGNRRLEALSLLMIEGAIGETLSTALFKVSVDCSEEPRSKASFMQILKDELRHARASWSALKELLVTATDEERSRLQKDLAAAFGSLEQQNALPVLQRLARGEKTTDALVALGVIQLEERVAVFYRTIENTIFSKLERLGFDPKVAWTHRFQLCT